MKRVGMERLAGLLLVGLLGMIGGKLAVAQEVALADRGPRFLLASANGTAKPVEIEAGSSVLLRQVVELNLEHPTVGGLLDEISRQTGLTFFYGQDVLSPDRPVTLQADSITVATALIGILMDARVDVMLTRGRQVALVSRRPRPAPAQQGSIAGRVIDKATSSPLGGAAVAVEGTRHSATTDTDGRYRIADVEAGTYTVRARYIGYAPLPVSVTVAEGETTADFALERSVQRLDEFVTVTPGGVQAQVKALPTPVSVITADDIAQRRPQTLQDVIRQAVPTAVAFENPAQPAQTAISVRGGTSLNGGSAMKVLVDGVEAAASDASPIDPTSIDRIEVIRGPQAATVYGADAAGGVIQIFTKRGDPDLVHPEVNLQAEAGVLQTPYDGFRGVLQQSYTGGVRGGGGEASYNFGGRYSRLSDWLPDGEFSRQLSGGLHGGIHYVRGIMTADLHARYFRNSNPSVNNPLLLTAGFSSFSRPSFQPLDFTNETYGARIVVAPTGWLRNQFTLGVDRFGFESAQLRPRLTTPDDTLLSINDLSRAKITLAYNASVAGRLSADIAGSLVAGLDHSNTDASNSSTSEALNTEGTILISPSGAFNESRLTITNTGYFTQAEAGWRETVFLTVGLRADDNSTFGEDLGQPVSPRVGVSVVRESGDATVKLRGAYGRTIKAPTPGFAFGQVTPVSITLANPLLEPERQRGWDAGIDLALGDRASISVTGYDQESDNLILFVQLASESLPTGQYQNVGRVGTRGVEVEGALSFGPARLKAQYGYVRARVEALGPAVSQGGDLQVGDQVPGTPSHTAGAAITVTPAPGTAVSAGLTYIGEYRDLDFLGFIRCLGNTGPCQPAFRDYYVAFPGFTKLNASIAQNITRQLRGFVSVDNLTNNFAYEGQSGSPVTGRVTTLGVQANF